MDQRGGTQGTGPRGLIADGFAASTSNRRRRRLVPDEIAKGSWDRCWPHLEVPLTPAQSKELYAAVLELALRHERNAWGLRFRRPLKGKRAHATSRDYDYLALNVRVNEPDLRIYPRDAASWSETAHHLGWQWLESAIERFQRLWTHEIERVKAEHGQDAWPWSEARARDSPSYASYRLTDLPD
jgi:hypothetical protein